MMAPGAFVREDEEESMIVKAVVTLAVCGLLAVAAPGQPDWDVYKDVPDVNKIDRPDIPGWPDAGDNSCWQAAAANLLGGAGYGTGATAQLRAESIYNQLITDLGWNNMGWADRAINYWLYTYGKNPDSAEYRPANGYTDVTAVYQYSPPLGRGDYNFLLDELARCQYVAVGWDMPPHCMTLVGGNYDQGLGSQSVWHDSDRTAPGAVSDDVYTNAFPMEGGWNLTDYQAWNAQSYVTLCEGLNKPQYAMSQYDVAWFRGDTDQDGVWDADYREAGLMKDVYDDPAWVDDYTFHVDNEYVEDYEKEVWLLVDYTDRVLGRQEDVRLVDDQGTEWLPTEIIESDDGGQLRFYWDLNYQPDWERIVFPDDRYYTLAGNVKDWDLSTYCVPEPAAAMLLVLATLALRRRR